jgi:hypothetical protein
MSSGRQGLEHGVGDIVQDGDCAAVVTDIVSGRYILRPKNGPMTLEWSPDDPEDLVLVRRAWQPEAQPSPHHPQDPGELRAVPDDFEPASD